MRRGKRGGWGCFFRRADWMLGIGRHDTMDGLAAGFGSGVYFDQRYLGGENMGGLGYRLEREAHIWIAWVAKALLGLEITRSGMNRSFNTNECSEYLTCTACFWRQMGEGRW